MSESNPAFFKRSLVATNAEAEEILQPLIDLIGQSSDKQYSQPLDELGGASLGAHTRHIVEMFQCLNNALTSGVVNYDERNRDRLIEVSRQLAMEKLLDAINLAMQSDELLIMETKLGRNSERSCFVFTSFLREYVHCLDHAIHHMAVLKVALRDIPEYRVDKDFGLAPSTYRYRNGN